METERKTREQIVKDFDEWLDNYIAECKSATSVLTHSPAAIAERNREVRRLIAEEKWEERQRELSLLRRQQAIDSVWERTLEARREIEEEGSRSCHVGPRDPDHWRNRR